MGKLGRNNIVILTDNDVEIPSDLSGVVYILIQLIGKLGYKVDLNKLF